MSHPALTPTLQRPAVDTLLTYLATEQATAEAIADRLYSPANREHYRGKAAGLARAAEMIADMWRAAEIASDAMNVHLQDLADLAALEWDDSDDVDGPQ